MLHTSRSAHVGDALHLHPPPPRKNNTTLRSKQQSKQVEDAEATKRAQEEADEKAKQEGKEAADSVDPVMKTEYDTVWDYAVQNDTKPLWLRSPKEVRGRRSQEGR